MSLATGGWTTSTSCPTTGLQYELLDGLLLVTPAPVMGHQRAAARMFLLLSAACTPQLEMFFAPVDW